MAGGEAKDLLFEAQQQIADANRIIKGIDEDYIAGPRKRATVKYLKKYQVIK